LKTLDSPAYRRHRQAERSRNLEIDDQLEFRWPQHMQIRGTSVIAKLGLIDSCPESTAGDAGRSTVATKLAGRPQGTTSTTAEDSLAVNRRAKIIRLYPHSVTFRGKLEPMCDTKGEYNVIRFPRAATAAKSRGGKAAKSPPKLGDDYHHRMVENTLAAAVLAVLVIFGEWICNALVAVH
jgi:hypothetical protein